MAARQELVVRLSGLESYVVVDRFVGGLSGGGLRYSLTVDVEELRRLARTMTHKWALLGLPFGGCKLGIRGDPRDPRKRAIIEEFARHSQEFVRNRIFTGPDMGTTPEDLRPFFSVLGQDSYDVVAGRLAANGYRPTAKDRYRSLMKALQEDVTGIVVARAAEAAWERIDGPFHEVAVSVQGFGSVGRAAVRELTRLGARVVCIADELGSLYDPEGLEAEQLVGRRPGIMRRQDLPPKTESLPSDAWLDVDADILLPAAISDAISWENVDRVRARMVVEAANIPVPEDVELHLHKRDILVLPDFVVNAGLAATFGVLVTSRRERPEEVEHEVISRVVDATVSVVEGVLEKGKPPREVAIRLARSRLEP